MISNPKISFPKAGFGIFFESVSVRKFWRNGHFSDYESKINHKSQVPNHKSQISNPKSSIPNLKSKISNHSQFFVFYSTVTLIPSECELNSGAYMH